MNFSERMGITKPRSVMQVNSIDEPLRVALFNYFYDVVYSPRTDVSTYFRTDVWCDYWRREKDSLPSEKYRFADHMKEYILKSRWYEVYNFIEFAFEKHVVGFYLNPDELNRILERDMAGFRLIDGKITPITDEAEIATLTEALEIKDSYSGARMHIQKAIGCLSLKPEPDLGGAAREAISAVESAAKVIAEDENADLRKALDVMKKRGIARHPVLFDAWQKMYAFTNDEKGIRHAAIENSVNVDFPLAKYMVVTSAAFVNYLIAEQAKL